VETNQKIDSKRLQKPCEINYRLVGRERQHWIDVFWQADYDENCGFAISFASSARGSRPSWRINLDYGILSVGISYRSRRVD